MGEMAQIKKDHGTILQVPVRPGGGKGQGFVKPRETEPPEWYTPEMKKQWKLLRKLAKW